MSLNTNEEIVSLGAINLVSPYTVTSLAGKKEVLCFSTKECLNYAVTFVKDDTLGIPNMYQLVIEEINHSHAPYDPAVKDTLIAILENFLSKEMNVLAFVCDTMDSREAARHALFNKWFLKYSGNSSLHKLDGIINAEGNMYYSSLICNKNNPFYNHIKLSYIGFIGDLQK